MNLDLIKERIVKYTNLDPRLSLTPVIPQGHDHRSFRYGSMYVVRIPSADAYKSQIYKEKELLPAIRNKLNLEIPEPIAFIPEDDDFKAPIAIYRWINGDLVSRLLMDGFVLADELALALVELRSIPVNSTWKAGVHNFYRGSHPSIYHDEVMDNLKALDPIRKDLFLKLWNDALETRWDKPDVFVHGDIAVGNLLCSNKHLKALIDFGTCGFGDPACDYSIAWTYFKPNERIHFYHLLRIDKDTWTRSQAWALWKALISMNNPDLKEWAMETLNQLEYDCKKKV